MNVCNLLSFNFAAGISVVYDSIETSPFYTGAKGDSYLDESDLIELQSPHQTGQNQIKEPYQKRYYFNPMNLPYNLEQPSSYSARQVPMGEKVGFSTSKQHS